MTKIAICLVVKNEAEGIGAWIAYHSLLGFGSFIILDDKSSDDTAAVAQAAGQVLDVRVLPWMEEGRGRQGAGYEKICRQFAAEFDWIAFIDADEYILPPPGDSLAAMLARQEGEGAAAVAIPWRMFGSAGHKAKPGGMLIEDFQYCARTGFAPNLHVKSIVRPALVKQGINPHAFVVDGNYRLADGSPVEWSQNVGVLRHYPAAPCWQVNHYFTRSLQHWAERMVRGQLGTFVRTLAEFDKYDRNEIFDDRAAALAPGVRAILNAPPPVSPPAITPPAPSPLAALPAEMPAPAPAAQPHGNTVFDIGMSEGNDTAFYLEKGFQVVGVEADIVAYYTLRERFAAECAAGRLTLYNFAVATRAGEIVEFFHHKQHQGLSGTSNSRAEFKPGSFDAYHVSTIDWTALTQAHGVPYYMKIDIEGQESAFLAGMEGCAQLPVYTSVEAHSLPPVEALFKLGYRRFRLVDQDNTKFKLPPEQKEGRQINWPVFHHSSGPFGRDLPEGPWLELEAFKDAWRQSRTQTARTWFDCHAWAP